MNKKQYQENRNALMNEAQKLINEGKIEEANAKMDEVKALDEKWKNICEAQANMNALEGEKKGVNIQNLTGQSIGSGTVSDKVAMFGRTQGTEKTEEMFASKEYEIAWAKSLMGTPLTADETDLVKMVNEYTHTTENTGIVIPKTVAKGIWDMIEEMYPLWNDIQKTYVNGNYAAIVGDTSTDAKWYDEDTVTEDGTETFREFTLSGCELSRAITVSWKLREMSIEDFIPYIQRQLARKMGAALGYGASHGKGKPSASEFKPEPLGIVTALEKEASTPRIATYTAGALSYKDLTAARAKIKIGANELKIYANNQTIWNEMANILDANGRPIFVPDPVNSGVYRILGMQIKEDDSMADGEILMSSPFVGYLANVNKDMSVMTEEHVKARKVDYCGYAIVDGGVTYMEAHSLLKYAAEGEEEPGGGA